MKYDQDNLRISQMEKGESLFHYTTTDALINIISTNELWITKWDYLNDMEEFKTALEVCEVVLKGERAKPEIFDDIKKEVLNGLESNRLIWDLYIISFTTDKDSQLLWSNYSNNDGVNIEVDFEKFVESLNHRSLWHGLVNYKFEKQKECLRQSFYDEIIGNEEMGNISELSQINILEGREYEMTISHMSVICILYSMFFKKECFEGEKEYRFVFTGVEEKELNFRNKNSIVTPYIKKKLENIECIIGVTIGPTYKNDMAKKGIEQLLSHYNKQVKVLESQIPLRY